MLPGDFARPVLHKKTGFYDSFDILVALGSECTMT